MTVSLRHYRQLDAQCQGSVNAPKTGLDADLHPDTGMAVVSTSATSQSLAGRRSATPCAVNGRACMGFLPEGRPPPTQFREVGEDGDPTGKWAVCIWAVKRCKV